MFIQRFALALLCLFLISGCQKAPEQQHLIMPELVVAVAPFTQPTQTAELLSGFIPEDQVKVKEEKLDELDRLFRQKLDKAKHKYVFLSRSDVAGALRKDERGRRNALVSWAYRARKAGADMIVVPQIISLRERVGGKAGVVTSALVNEDFYLIDARDPAALLQRSHFSEEQQPLVNDLTRIGSFFRRGGSWLTASELAGEGMDKAVKEFGL